MTDPSDELLNHLGLKLVAPLGGRVNSHWRVAASDGEAKVLRRWGSDDPASLGYEIALIEAFRRTGWPVPSLTEPVFGDGSLWSLAPLLEGAPSIAPKPEEQANRGRLLARFHEASASLHGFGQRPGWRRCEEILADGELDRILAASEAKQPEEISIIRWHLDRARRRAEAIDWGTLPVHPVHGDFTTWNLLFVDGRLTAVIDFELAHSDYRVGDFCLSWRGKYDTVVLAYTEVLPLDPQESAALVPVWWASLIEAHCRTLALGLQDGGWTVGKLMERTPLFGPDADVRPAV